MCQQTLVTAAVLTVGLSAAGVKTLDIVPAPSNLTEHPSALQREPRPAPAAAAPVTPEVREVAVSGIERATPPERRPAPARPRARAGTPSPAPTPAPSSARSSAAAAPETPTSPTSGPQQRLVAQTQPEQVHGYATVGATWSPRAEYADDQITVQMRTEKDGRWSSWTTAEYHDEHSPSAAEAAEAGERPGTDPLVIGDVDRVQMRALTSDASVPSGLRLAVIDPGQDTLTEQAPAIDTSKLPAPARPSGSGEQSQAAQAQAAQSQGATAGQDEAVLSAMKVAPQPFIYSRAQWGANEKLRDQSAPSYGTIKAGFIHHTVNANDYAAADVPSLLRGIYAYHTQSKGWRDIGYNFLVDRFGRIWEGRYGGVTRPVVGAHTLGYNEYAFAMSAIGNFDVATPPSAVAEAYAELFAWKLSLYDIRADATRVYVKDRYLAAINGHRDTGQTACPGKYLYAQLPAIRTAAQKLQNAAQRGTTPTPTPTPKPSPTPTPTPPPSEFTSPTQSPRPATRQPANISFAKAMNLAGSAYPDLVLKSAQTGDVRVLTTGGQTGFAAPVYSSGPWAKMSKIVAVGDVTGDGRGDVLAEGRKRRVSKVYRGNGAGTISSRGIARTKAFAAADLVVPAGDWNGDGRADVLMRTRSNGWLWAVTGRGNGAFSAPRLLSKDWSGFSTLAVVGDLTGDKRQDVVGVHRGVLYIVPMTAQRGLGTWIRQGNVATSHSTLLGGAGDYSGDGWGDVVARSASTGQLSILTGRGDGTLGPVLGPFSAAPGLRLLSAAQVSGGAAPDVVGREKGGSRLVVVPSNNLANTAGLLPGNLRLPGATQVLNVGDWNRDGKGDVITRHQEGDRLLLRPGLGNGQFAKGVVMSDGWTPFTNLAAVGDVTGDGRPDLVGRTAKGEMRIFPGDGATGFKAPTLPPASLRTFNQIGSGVWKPQAMPSSAFLGSDGSFVPYTGSNGGDLAGYDWVIGLGDVDGNGVADLVVRDSAGTLWLLPGSSTGYLARRFIASGFAGYSVAG